MKASKEICDANDFIAWYNYIDFVTLFLHKLGTKYVYISIQYGNIGTTYHRLKIYTLKSGRKYILVGKSRIHLDKFHSVRDKINVG